MEKIKMSLGMFLLEGMRQGGPPGTNPGFPVKVFTEKAAARAKLKIFGNILWKKPDRTLYIAPIMAIKE
jgi:hypothetical protein